MTQLVHSRQALDRFGEPIRVPEELRGLFTACVFDRKLAVIVRPGSQALASRWFVLDLTSVEVSPGVWLPGVFRRPPGSLIIEARDLTMKVVEPARYFATGESMTQQSVAMLATLRRQRSPSFGAGTAQINLDLDLDFGDAPAPQVTSCE